MSSSATLLLQRGLLALSLLAAIMLFCFLSRRRLAAYEESASRARSNRLLVEVLANMSEGLDRLEAGLDDIAAGAAAAKTKLSKLVAAKTQNFLACALLRDGRQSPPAKKQASPKRTVAAPTT